MNLEGISIVICKPQYLELNMSCPVGCDSENKNAPGVWEVPLGPSSYLQQE